MRAQLARMVAAFAGGRDPADVMASIAILFGLAGMLWLSACVFLITEPVS